MIRKHQLLCSILLYTSFSVYLFLLLYVLIFQRLNFGGERYLMRSISIIPFRTIRIFLSSNAYGIFDLANIFGNIFVFAPLGLYMAVIWCGKKIRIYAGWILLFSLSVEILQWILWVGAADIDDIILNCLGGILGLMAYKILLALFRQEYRVRAFTAILLTVIGVPVFFIAIATYNP